MAQPPAFAVRVDSGAVAYVMEWTDGVGYRDIARCDGIVGGAHAESRANRIVAALVGERD